MCSVDMQRMFRLSPLEYRPEAIVLSKLSLAGLSLSWEDELSRGLGGYIVDTKSRHDFFASFIYPLRRL